MSMPWKEEFELPPLRTLDDFLLQSARFQIPEFKDMERWANRVYNNLIYYQTNYFACTLGIVLIVSAIYPVQLFHATLALILAYGFFYNESLVTIRNSNPTVNVGMIIAAGIIFVNLTRNSLPVFLYGVVVPLSATLLHSSLRMRNLKNKFTNQMEIVGISKTPMRILLETIFQEEMTIRWKTLQ